MNFGFVKRFGVGLTRSMFSNTSFGATNALHNVGQSIFNTMMFRCHKSKVTKLKIKTKGAMKKRFRFKKSGRVEFHPSKLSHGKMRMVTVKKVSAKMSGGMFQGTPK
jgi:ribosomal protein L35